MKSGKNNRYDCIIFSDPEEMISCPYNKAHQIRRKRIQFHLVKCKKNYPDSNLQTCFYNTVHKIPEPEMKVKNGSFFLTKCIWGFVAVSPWNLSG